MAFTGPLEDRQLIRDLMGAYADAAFRKSVEDYLACWAEDGVRIGQGAEVRGKAALRAQWEQFGGYFDKMSFFTEIGAIEVSGDHARTRCYCREILFLTGGAIRKVVGQYEDELTRENGAWLFTRREYTLFMDEGVIKL